LRAFSLTLLILTVLLSCSAEDSPALCIEECSQTQICDEETGLCIDKPGEEVVPVNASLLFDAGTRAGVLYVVVYDRALGGFLYGMRAEDGDEVKWRLAAGAEFDNPFYTPRAKLLFAGNKPLALLELDYGALFLVREISGQWTAEPLLALDGSLSHLDAVYIPDVGIHMCIGDEQGDLLFAGFEGQTLTGPDKIQLPPEFGAAAVPGSIVRLAGTTIIAAARPKGLLSISTSNETGWNASVIDPDVRPAAIACEQTDDGLITTYLDRDTGQLKYASGDSASVSIQLVDEDVLSVDTELPAAALRLALGGVESGKTFLAHFHFTEMELHLSELSATGSWKSVGSAAYQTAFVPSLGMDGAGNPFISGIVAPPPGQTGPGRFEIVHLP